METSTNGEVLRVTGLDSLSGANAEPFKILVKARLLPENRLVEIDFSQVRIVDSEGLGALISIHRYLAPRHGRVRLVQPRQHIRQLLDLVKFDRILEIVEQA
jgi:anti-sigma B factor antagonist